MYILLVDANSYRRKLDEQILPLKDRYFRIKNIVRKNTIGEHMVPFKRNYSVGLMRIGTLLKENGCKIKYISLFDDVIKIVCEECPDVVAFSSVCPTIDICAAIAKKIRKKFYSKIRIVVGGAHINVASKMTKDKYKNIFDEYVSGYESNVINIITGKQFDNIKLPQNYVDYSILPYPISEYFINTFRSLGCIFNCQYCQDKFIPYFERSIEKDMLFFINNLPPKTLIHFFDSSIIGRNYEEFVKMCCFLKDLNHNMCLSCDIRPEQISEETIQLLVDAGFVEIRVGIESSSMKVLNSVDRKMQVSEIAKRLELVKKCSNLYTSIYILSGLIGSDKTSSAKTRNYVCDLLSKKIIDEIKNGIYVPYPIDGVNYSNLGVDIFNTKWQDYDRQSFPVYNLPEMSANDIWEDFVMTTEDIVKTWVKTNGITEQDLSACELYSEYNALNYEVMRKRYEI